MATYMKSLSLRELKDLYQFNHVGLEGRVAKIIGHMREDERRITACLGREATALEVLDVGPGQRAPYQYYFSGSNTYTGIDIEPRQTGNVVAGFIDDLRHRGNVRAIKTMGRRLLGVDKRFHQRMCEELRIKELEGDILCMDATDMQFEDESFDLVVSRSVFEHIPDPEPVISEIARVLRPGGVASIVTHLYTSDSGIHDTRIFTGQRDEIPYWSHLRPEHAHKVQANSYLNKLRLAEYREKFERHWPGLQEELVQDPSPEAHAELKALRARGELAEFSDEELLSTDIVTVWKKPESAPTH